MSRQTVIYRVYFKFKGSLVFADMPPNQGIANLSSGFWIDDILEFCLHVDSKYWIPVSQVRHVEKIPK